MQLLPYSSLLMIFLMVSAGSRPSVRSAGLSGVVPMKIMVGRPWICTAAAAGGSQGTSSNKCRGLASVGRNLDAVRLAHHSCCPPCQSLRGQHRHDAEHSTSFCNRNQPDSAACWQEAGPPPNKTDLQACAHAGVLVDIQLQDLHTVTQVLGHLSTHNTTARCAARRSRCWRQRPYPCKHPQPLCGVAHG